MSETANKPLVSIGLPVYNEERFVRQTIESLLAQDCQNLELVISDNGSTDGTEAICRYFADSDQRVRYERSEVNLGAFVNFNRAFDLTVGEYFMWAGAHDLWGPTFVSRALEMLTADSRLVLVYPRVATIDAAGNQLGVVEDSFEVRDQSDLKRYLHLIWDIQSCNMFHGLIRRDSLSHARLKHVWGADVILLAELTLRGGIAQIPEVLFSRRVVRPEENEDADVWKKRALETVEGPAASKKQDMSLEELFREMRNEELRVIWKSHLSLADRLRACKETIRCARSRYGVLLPADVILRNVAAMRNPQAFWRKLRSRLHRAQNA